MWNHNLKHHQSSLQQFTFGLHNKNSKYVLLLQSRDNWKKLSAIANSVWILSLMKSDVCIWLFPQNCTFSRFYSIIIMWQWLKKKFKQKRMRTKIILLPSKNFPSHSHFVGKQQHRAYTQPKKASIHAKLHTVQSIKMVTFFREGKKCQKRTDI